MKFYLWVAALLLVVIGTNSQDFDLSDAVDPVPTVPPKVPEKPKLNDPEPAKPKKPSDGGFDLLDAFGEDPEPAKPKKPTSRGGGGGTDGFDLGDALGPDPNPKPDKPVVPPNTGGGGGGFDDSDLWDEGKGGELKPDEGGDGADQPQEAGAGQIAGIASAVGMAVLGAASSYFAYQKKKLCFKIQGGADPESGKDQQGNRGQPNLLLSNLLRTS
ncbi:unnamed protein product [Lota lota]